MDVLDPGHIYRLDSLDEPDDLIGGQVIQFVKREGPLYPGNEGAHPGTTSQEVLRALIERGEYVCRQMPSAESALVVELMKAALYLLEVRAARRHGRHLEAPLADVVSGAGKCPRCGHVGCQGHEKEVER